MDIYVHTVPEQGFHGARMGIKAYRTLAEALAAGHPESSIERHLLHGILNGDTVYAAHRYDRAPDTHDLVGIYADHASAEEAAGDPCHTVSLKLVQLPVRNIEVAVPHKKCGRDALPRVR